jgi:hypothetical protein
MEVTQMTISNQIIEVLDYIGNKFGIAIDWTSAEVVPILQELAQKYIRWEISTSILWIGLMLFLTLCYVGGIMLYNKLNNDVDKWNFDYNPVPYVFVLLGCFLGVISLTCIIAQSLDIVRCYTFPELQIAQYISTFMNN